MRKQRRIEITAFRSSIQIASGSIALDSHPDNGISTEQDIWISDPSGNEAIAPESAEGRRILIDAVSLLQRSLNNSETGENQ